MAMTSLNFRLEEELLADLNKYCEENKIGRAELIRRLILKELSSSKIKKVTKKDIEKKINDAFSQKEKLLQINFESRTLITKIGINTTNTYAYELIENNNILLIRDNIGAITKVINL